MKLKTTIILSIVFISINAFAGKRGITEINSIARKTLFPAKTRAMDSHSLRIIDANEMLTIVGDNQEGLVIVPNDDAFPEVIGYSNASFSELPPALKWYIAAASDAMRAMANDNICYAAIPPSSDYPAHVDQLLSTTWDQGKPYNNLCPGGNGAKSSLYPTGCVATAMAQIMKFHNYPEVGIGSHQYSFQPSSGDGRIISAEFGETHYDWNNMLDDYSAEYTSEQANAVATLMLHCGVAVDMGYTESGSGSYAVEACQGIRKYFGYNEGACLYSRDYFSAELWMQMLFEELSKKRPVYYSGSSEVQGGHAFVIDGYDENGLVHVNWGWGGKTNGFYDIALLNPSNYQFSNNQHMILNICKPTEVIASKSQLGAQELNFNFYGTSVKRISIKSTKLINIGADAFKGSIAAILQNADTTIVLKSQEDNSLNPYLDGVAFYGSVNLMSISLSNIPDGTYILFVGSKSTTDTQWQLIRTLEGITSSYTIKIEGGNVSYEANQSDLWSASTTTAITSVRNSTKHNQHLIYDLRGRKLGTDASTLPKGVYIIDGKKVVK